MGVRKGLLLGAAAYAAWGLLSPGNELLLREFDPLWLQAIRGVAAALVLAPFLTRTDWKAVGSYCGRLDLLTLAFMGNGISFTLFVLGQTRLPATFTTLGFYTAPIWTALLGWLWLREPVGRVFGATLAVLLVGGWLTLGSPGLEGASVDAWGVLLAVGSGASWAIYTVMLRKHDALPFKPLLWFSLAAGGVWFLVGSLLFEPFPDLTVISTSGWAWTVIQLLVPTLLALALFQASLRHAPAARINVLVGLELAGTVLWAWILLGHTLDLVQTIGLAMVLGAVSVYLWIRAVQEEAPAIAPMATD